MNNSHKIKMKKDWKLIMKEKKKNGMEDQKFQLKLDHVKSFKDAQDVITEKVLNGVNTYIAIKEADKLVPWYFINEAQ